MKIKNFVIPFFAFGGIVICYSCKKDPCIKDCPSCSDEIQTQNETGIDCGGPCRDCLDYWCNGNGKNTYFPLKKNFWWKYSQPPAIVYIDERDRIIIGDTILGDSLKYYIMAYDYFYGEYRHEYIREDSNGDIYAYRIKGNDQLANAESFYLPAKPYVGQYWKNAELYPDSFIITSVNATLNFNRYGCKEDTGLIKVQAYGGIYLEQTRYYKKGLGLIYLVRHSQIISEDTRLRDAYVR